MATKPDPLSMPLERLYGLPEGITISRDPYSGAELRWLVHDAKTGLGEVVRVNPDDFQVLWTPPPKPRWWRWLSPLGAALDSLDRSLLIQRMHGKYVTDWNAVDDAARKLGGDALRRVLAQRGRVETFDREFVPTCDTEGL